MSEKPIFVSGDTRITKGEEDALMASGIKTVTVEELVKLAEMARCRFSGFLEVAKRNMTRERAQRIRELRSDNSWRGVALHCFTEWTADGLIEDDDHWYPPTNQLMGMALCKAAAELLGESPEAYPWQNTI